MVIRQFGQLKAAVANVRMIEIREAIDAVDARPTHDPVVQLPRIN